MSSGEGSSSVPEDNKPEDETQIKPDSAEDTVSMANSVIASSKLIFFL